MTLSESAQEIIENFCKIFRKLTRKYFFENLRWDCKETDWPVILFSHSIIFFKQRGNLGSFDIIWKSTCFYWMIYKVCNRFNYGVFSSSEAKAHRWAYSIGRHPSSVRPSVRPSVVRPFVRQHFQTTSPLKPWSRFFPYFTYSIYRWGERIIVLFFQSDKNSGCYGNVEFPLTDNGKSGKWQFVLSHCRYLDFFLQKCFLGSPLRFIWILSKSLNLFGCHGNINGKFSKHYSKIFFSEAIRGWSWNLAYMFMTLVST